MISIGVWGAVKAILSQVSFVLFLVFLYLIDSQILSYKRVTSSLECGVCHQRLSGVTKGSP